MRDILTLGRGKAFETLKAMDYFESLMAELKKEQESPLEFLTENARVARKNLEKTHWWMASGLYSLTLGSPTQQEVLEAQTEYENATYIWKQAYNALIEAREKQI